MYDLCTHKTFPKTKMNNLLKVGLTLCLVAFLSACGGGGSDSKQIDATINSPTTQTSPLTFNLGRGVLSYFTDIGTKRFDGNVTVTINGITYTGTSNYSVSNQFGTLVNDMFNDLRTRIRYDESNLFDLDKNSYVILSKTITNYDLKIGSNTITASFGNAFLINGNNNVYSQYNYEYINGGRNIVNAYYLENRTSFWNLPSAVKVGDKGNWYTYFKCKNVLLSAAPCAEVDKTNITKVDYLIEPLDLSSALIKVTYTPMPPTTEKPSIMYFKINQNSVITPYSETAMIDGNTFSVRYK